MMLDSHGVAIVPHFVVRESNIKQVLHAVRMLSHIFTDGKDNSKLYVPDKKQSRPIKRIRFSGSLSGEILHSLPATLEELNLSGCRFEPNIHWRYYEHETVRICCVEARLGMCMVSGSLRVHMRT
jgi:hypothetical protein